MDVKSLVSYILQSIDMGLGASMQDESSYNDSFSVDVDKSGIKFIPRTPAGYLIDNDLYQRIFKILNAALYPRFTLLKQNSAYFIPMNTNDIHEQRALFFPWKIGIPRRMVIPDLKEYVIKNRSNNIKIMKDYEISYDNTVGIAIAGNSGSGKSYMLTYLLEVLKPISDLIVIDPKMDEPSRWARFNGIKVIFPEENRSKSDFVSQVNAELSESLKLIHRRQKILFDNPNTIFKHKTIVIDEVLALSEGVNAAIKNSFFALLSQVALLGRATRVHLLLASQRFDHAAVPTSVREQINVLIQLGNINRKTTQFLFPDLDPEGIVIPQGKGTGLIQVIDNEHPYQVMPLLCPTYYTKEKIL